MGHSWNAACSMVTTLLGISNLPLLPFGKATVWLFSSFTDWPAWSKASFPIVVIWQSFPKFTLSRYWHPLNAASPIPVTLLEKVTDLREFLLPKRSFGTSMAPATVTFSTAGFPPLKLPNMLSLSNVFVSLSDITIVVASDQYLKVWQLYVVVV